MSEDLLRIYLIITIMTSTADKLSYAMMRLKSCLRSTMTQQRFNNGMLLHIHKYDTDNFDLIDVVRQFASCNERRDNYFAKL